MGGWEIVLSRRSPHGRSAGTSRQTRQTSEYSPLIFTTGFSRNAVIHNGVLDKDVNFLAKTPDFLAALRSEVRNVAERVSVNPH